MAVEPDFGVLVEEECNGRPVVQDHPRVVASLPGRLAAEIQQALRVEQRVGVPLEPARVPGQVDHQAGAYLAGVCAGGLTPHRCAAEAVQEAQVFRRQIRPVGTVAVEESLPVPDGLALRQRLGDVLPNRRAGFGHRRVDVDLDAGLGASGTGRDLQGDVRRRPIARRATGTLGSKPRVPDQCGDAALQRPPRHLLLKGCRDLADGHGGAMVSNHRFDGVEVVFGRPSCHGTVLRR